MIMEAGRSHDMLATNWRTREASVIQSESKGLELGQRPETWGKLWCRSQNPKTQESWFLMSQGRGRWMVQFQRESEFVLPSLFCFIWAPNRLNAALLHIWGGSSSFSVSTQMLFSSETSSQTYPDMFYQPSGYPLIQPNWYKINHQMQWVVLTSLSSVEIAESKIS